MGITETQRLRRAKYLCASDMPVILGLSPYKTTPGDIYWSKTVPLPEDQDDGTDTESMSTGRRLEGVLLDWAAEELSVSILRNQWRVAQEGPGAHLFAAHPDAVVQGKPDGLEAKYCNAEAGQAYGEEGTDEVPDHVVVQAQCQMLAGRLDRVWVPVAIAGYSLDFRLYCVRRDDELIGSIVESGLKWWQDHVIARVPPTGFGTPPLAVLKRIGRVQGRVVDLPAEAAVVIKEWEEVKAVRKAKEDQEEALKAEIITLLGDAEAGRLPDGRLLTWLSQNSAPKCNSVGLRAEYPEAYMKYFSQGTHRVLRVKKAK